MSNKSITTKDKETKGLTVEKLRTFEGFEDIGDSEGEEIIKSLDVFSSIVYDCFKNNLLKDY